MSATVQDILNRHWLMHKTFDNLADKIAIHLNDTHPVLSIPELMHRLIDEHKFKWLDAWEVVEQVFSYTNHTLMSEALETLAVGHDRAHLAAPSAADFRNQRSLPQDGAGSGAGRQRPAGAGLDHR